MNESDTFDIVVDPRWRVMGTGRTVEEKVEDDGTATAAVCGVGAEEEEVKVNVVPSAKSTRPTAGVSVVVPPPPGDTRGGGGVRGTVTPRVVAVASFSSCDSVVASVALISPALGEWVDWGGMPPTLTTTLVEFGIAGSDADDKNILH